ncbi:hypothetical protein EDB81DRAFT_161940 [Dactylonectria macrodidyma]|uniref:Ubiquitin carboxyl-terminal hydrolase 19 n=1 Tax=Dactylonectria macrodidyma TaxID=307937 RepID=A0A9P9FN18_9HYPO|nr:hypothetical protein EDB81DRAFT_161940 [Dactylonectria macrodidyma]
MDPRFPTSRDDLYNLQMELKQVQYTQSNHAERILRLEKRQADDAALKSVWNSPFPGVLGGTPQQGPIQMPHADVFDDLDEQGEQLLGSLHLGPAEEEPVRRGAASRANSVRFDESALHGSNWGGQSSRHSGDFGPVRPGSGLMMERSLSHKSDGRHSSAGHSVHSHHSVASGRASSLGLDNNFAVRDDDEESFDIPEPPPSFFVLGTVPSIVRCWLTTNFAHGTLLYADICSGSQKSTVDFSLLRELELLDEVQRESDGVYRIRLNVYFAEAVVTHHGNRSDRSDSPRAPVPSITVFFEVSGTEQATQSTTRKAIRIFLGSDALRAYSADILFSQNTMTLYGDERERLQVPFVRPEDDTVFRNLGTSNLVPEKHKLNATAAPFVLEEAGQGETRGEISDSGSNAQHDDGSQTGVSPTVPQTLPSKGFEPTGSLSDAGGEPDRPGRDANSSESGSRDGRGASSSAEPRRGSSAGIWGSWRQGASNGADGLRETTPLSGYQPAGRGSRNMKVLKPQKSGSTSARTGTSYDPPPWSKASSEGRRKSQPTPLSGENGNRWDTKRVASTSGELKSQSQPQSQLQTPPPQQPQQPLGTRESRNANTMPRPANPVGVASAFSWMTPSTKPKGTTTGMD